MAQLIASMVREDMITIKGKESIGLSKSEIEKLMKKSHKKRERFRRGRKRVFNRNRRR